ncbi:MAG: hypothetical protein SGJ18_00220, partial [Pseudomonadota bacterium]|nr:hypothetical protein [Pseudomonadota bacterium]
MFFTFALRICATQGRVTCLCLGGKNGTFSLFHARNQVIRAVIDYAARVLRACSSGVGTCSPRLASL